MMMMGPNGPMRMGPNGPVPVGPNDMMHNGPPNGGMMNSGYMGQGPRMMMGPGGPMQSPMSHPMSGMGPGDPMSPMSGLGPGGPGGPDSPHGSGPGTPTVPLGPSSHPTSNVMDMPGGYSGPSPVHPGGFNRGGPSPAPAGPGMYPGAPSPAQPGLYPGAPSPAPPSHPMASPAHSFGGPSPAHPGMGRVSPAPRPPSMGPPALDMAPPHTSAPLGRDTIYPPDQPVIFNQQNPSAPPIYPCGICRKEVHENDQAILCESGCNFWFHRSCTGLAEVAFHYLTQEIYAEWVCDNCFNSKEVPLVKFKS